MTQPTTIVHARSTSMLRTALGPAIAGWLDDSDVAEVMLNPDGRLWVDRLDTGMVETGVFDNIMHDRLPDHECPNVATDVYKRPGLIRSPKRRCRPHAVGITA